MTGCIASKENRFDMYTHGRHKLHQAKIFPIHTRTSKVDKYTSNFSKRKNNNHPPLTRPHERCVDGWDGKKGSRFHIDRIECCSGEPERDTLRDDGRDSDSDDCSIAIGLANRPVPPTPADPSPALEPSDDRVLDPLSADDEPDELELVPPPPPMATARIACSCAGLACWCGCPCPCPPCPCA